MSDEAPQKACVEGLPAWMGTFADLMSLLMCFFVLLLSFSEMDVAKYKQLAGSMKMAFGVQRTIKAKEPPKGINVVAKEFSPGRPEPTPLNEVRQMTTQESSINLDLGKERRRPVPTAKAQSNRGVASGDKKEQVKGGQNKQTAGLTPIQKETLIKAKQAAKKRMEEDLKKSGALDAANIVTASPAQVVKVVKISSKAAGERQKKLKESARLISNALGKEIKAGAVEVELENKKIIIRIKEKASFGSGTGNMKRSFRRLLGKVANILKGSEGMIKVAGHTDDIPIHNEIFRSNWELSSSRAVSVVHAMMQTAKIPAKRFLVEGYADTQPMVPNTSAANRATNRRVEITLIQGDDELAEDTEINAEEGLVTSPAASLAGQPQTMPEQTSSPATENTVTESKPDKRPTPRISSDVKRSVRIKSKGIRAAGSR
ncbi:MAG: MotB family protein [Gammaproteobacteria bacterium]